MAPTPICANLVSPRWCTIGSPIVSRTTVVDNLKAAGAVGTFFFSVFFSSIGVLISNKILSRHFRRKQL